MRATRRAWVPVLLLATTAIAAAMLGADMQHALRYERAAILRGEVWRLFTGNIVHLGSAHAALNAMGLLALFSLFGRTYTAPQWGVVLLVCALSTSLGLLAFKPHIAWYVGLSGALHGAFVAGAIAETRRGHRSGYLWLALVGAKLVADFSLGSLHRTATFIGGDLVVAAHAFGAVGGLAGLVMPIAKAEVSRPS